MALAGGDAVETVKDTLQLALLHPDPIILDADTDLAVFVSSTDRQVQGHIGAAVLDRVVEEVEEDVGEVNLISLHPRIQGIQVQLQVSATLLGVEGINLRYGQEQLIDVQGL